MALPQVGRRLGVKLPAQGRQAQFLFFPQTLDLKDELDVGRAVEAVPGAPPRGLEELSLVFPITQHVSVYPGNPAHLTDGVEGLARDIFFWHLSVITEGCREGS